MEGPNDIDDKIEETVMNIYSAFVDWRQDESNSCWLVDWRLISTLLLFLGDSLAAGPVVQVNYKFKLMEETLYLKINRIDRFLYSGLVVDDLVWVSDKGLHEEISYWHGKYRWS